MTLIPGVVAKGPNSVVVLDNCTLHFSDEVSAIVRDCKAHIVYLSAYSPDYNPIEKCFAQIQKQLWRRYKHSQRSSVDSLYLAMSAITSQNMRNYYRSCGLDVPKETDDEDNEDDDEAELVASLLVTGVL